MSLLPTRALRYRQNDFGSPLSSALCVQLFVPYSIALWFTVVKQGMWIDVKYEFAVFYIQNGCDFPSGEKHQREKCMSQCAKPVGGKARAYLINFTWQPFVKYSWLQIGTYLL